MPDSHNTANETCRSRASELDGICDWRAEPRLFTQMRKLRAWLNLTAFPHTYNDTAGVARAVGVGLKLVRPG
jgi:hypothetical protein